MKLNKAVSIKRTPIKGTPQTKRYRRTIQPEPTSPNTHTQSPIITTQQLISQFNSRLQDKCPSIQLQLDTIRNISGDIHRYTQVDGPMTRSQTNKNILCLNKDHICIASLELYTVPHTDWVVLNSATSPNEEGKKYNTLLRTILVLIGTSIPGVHKIFSAAYNPISAWLFIRNYNVIIDMHLISNSNLANYLTSLNKTDPTLLSQSEIRAFYQQYTNSGISIFIPLTSENTHKANQLLDKLLSDDLTTSIQCI